MKYLVIGLLLTCSGLLQSQTIVKPGFDAKEYLELLALFSDKLRAEVHEDSTSVNYNLNYRSASVGFDNQWSLWTHKDKKLAAIIIRGTTDSLLSWMENFYAGMLPAQGQIHYSNGSIFKYHFSDNVRSTVHAGWTIGLGYMYADIEHKMDSLVKCGYQNFIVMGHSQGAAIATLFRAQLEFSSKINLTELKLKTYISACPKPGNLYFSYDFAQYTKSIWGLSIINPVDWVPETPITIQTLRDFNELNPFANVDKALKSMPLLQRVVLKHYFNKANGVTNKAQARYTKYLGGKAYKAINSDTVFFQEPNYVKAMNYFPVGTPIVLKADSSVLADSLDYGIFKFHGARPYYHLAKKQFINND